MVTFSIKDDITTERTPAKVYPEKVPTNYTTVPPGDRICKDCRFYALLWLAFLCILGGVVAPLIIIEVSEMPESSANIFALVCAIAGLSAYLFFRPLQIRKADKEFADMGYNTHIHI